MRFAKITCIAILVLIIEMAALVAQIPEEVAYQGRLIDNAGKSVPDGDYNMTFRLYEDSVGGTAAWEQSKVVEVRGGNFYARLGSGPIPLPPIGCLKGKCLEWLETEVEGEVQNPRTKLSRTFYAGSAGNMAGDIITWPGAVSVLWPPFGAGSTDTTSIINIVSDSIESGIEMVNFNVVDASYRTINISADTGEAKINLADITSTDNNSLTMQSNINGPEINMITSADIIARDSSVIRSGSLEFYHSEDGGISFDTTLIERNRILLQSGDDNVSLDLSDLLFRTASDNVSIFGTNGLALYNDFTLDTSVSLNNNGLLLGGGGYATNISPYSFEQMSSAGKIILDTSGLRMDQTIGASNITMLRLSSFDGEAYFEGDVGIGAAAPSEKLEVNGTIYSNSGGFKYPDGSVQTSAAINSGVSQYFNGGSITAPSTPGSPISRSITCPTDGYVLALFSCETYTLHNSLEATELRVGLSMISGSYLPADEKRWQIPTSCPTGTYGTLLSVHHIFPVSQGDTTIYVTLQDISSYNSIYVADYVISLMFIPESYGLVTKSDNISNSIEPEITAASIRSNQNGQPEENSLEDLNDKVSQLEYQLNALKSSLDKAEKNTE